MTTRINAWGLRVPEKPAHRPDPRRAMTRKMVDEAATKAVKETLDLALGADPTTGPTGPNGPAPMPTPDPAKRQAAALEKLRSMQAAGVRIL